MRQKKLKEFLDKLLESAGFEYERHKTCSNAKERFTNNEGILQSLASGGRVGFKKDSWLE